MIIKYKKLFSDINPESFASEYGAEIIEAYLKIVKEYYDDTIKKANAAS